MAKKREVLRSQGSISLLRVQRIQDADQYNQMVMTNKQHLDNGTPFWANTDTSQKHATGISK